MTREYSKETTMRRGMIFWGAAAVIVGVAAFGSQRAAAQTPQMSQAQNACAAAGLNPSEAPFAYCVASLREQANPQYAVDDNGMKARRACATMGYNPATAQYSSCVGNLDQTLSDSQSMMR